MKGDLILLDTSGLFAMHVRALSPSSHILKKRIHRAVSHNELRLLKPFLEYTLVFQGFSQVYTWLLAKAVQTDGVLDRTVPLPIDRTIDEWLPLR